MTQHPDDYTLSEAAKLLDVPVDRLRKAAYRGTLATFKDPSGVHRVRHEHLQEAFPDHPGLTSFEELQRLMLSTAQHAIETESAAAEAQSVADELAQIAQVAAQEAADAARRHFEAVQARQRKKPRGG